MKYCVYDKAADGYLTKMVFDGGLSNDTQFECGLNEYITNAKLLDTKKAAVDTIARIESFKFMEKGRFVVHQFDDTLGDQYIISEAGNPTKVVDNITVDLDGTINVKYGTMACHWSTTSLEYAVNRMNALQKAKSPKYTAWCNTFDIYKVLTVIDERSCTHCQFIKVTDKGLVKYSKDEEEKLLVDGREIINITSLTNKRIEELEKANYDLGEQVTARGAVANRLQEENDKLKAAVESIKKEAETLDILKDVVDTIYTDLQSVTACDDLKDTLKALSHNSDLDHIFMPTKTSYVLDKGNCLTAKDEIYYIVNHMITMYESAYADNTFPCITADASGLLKDVIDIANAKRLANNIIDICEATTDTFEVTLKKFSQLYEAVNDPMDDDGAIMYALKSVLVIFSSLEDKVRNIIDESVAWKHKAAKAEKDLDNQKKLNETFNTTIVRYRNKMYDMDKKVSNAADWLEEVNDKNEKLTNMLKEITDYVADIMLATRTVDNDKMISDLTDVSFKIGVKTVDDGPIHGISIILNVLIRKIKEATEWKASTEEAIYKCKAKDKDYEMLKNKLEVCKEIQKFTSIRDSLAEVIFAIRNAIYHNDSDAFRCIENHMKLDSAFNSDPFMAGVRENIKDICAAEKKNIANHELKNDEIAKLSEKIKKLKSQFNSMYGYYDTDDAAIDYCLHDVMITGGRCCGKQVMADILSGKKIPISKDKYDSILTSLKLIDLSYEGVYGTTIRISPKPKPTWLPGLMTEIENLTT